MADKAEREQIALYVCKVCPCPNRQKHSWEECIYAHPKENARRRDVRKFRYIAEPCPDYANKEFCDLGDDCPFAHGTFEINLHPSKYCTKICTKFPHCDRKICFFAHGEEQLRQPDLSFGYASVAEAECVRQNLLTMRSRNAGLHHSTNAFTAPQLKRISPLQIPPPLRSPPQQTRACSIADGFRASLPAYSADLFSPYSSLSPAVLEMQSDRGYAAPPMVDYASPFGGKRLASAVDGRMSLDENSMSDRQSLQSIASSLEAASTVLMSPNTSVSLESSGPRMSMKKARELGLQPPSKRSSSLPDLVQGMKAGLRSPVSSRQMPKMSPQSQPKSPWKSNPTMVISPQGRRMPLEEAINLVSYLSGPEKGPGSKSSNLANMASAITTLYSMGYTLADDEVSHSEGMEEDRGSDKSSPDIHRQRQMAPGFGTAHPLLNSPATTAHMSPAVPQGSQYAAMLAGIGLNLTAENLLHQF